MLSTHLCLGLPSGPFPSRLPTTHSWSWILEKPPIVQPRKNFPGFYGTQRFITVFTRALHWSLSWATSTQSIPSHYISVRSILILSHHLLTYLRSWALLEEQPIVQPLINFPAFYGTRRFNTVFTRALHWSPSWAISIQSTPLHPILSL
jgi:hypothetical protein